MTWEQDMATLAHDRGPALVGYAYLLTGELHAAQDLVQDALVQTFSRRSASQVEHLEAYVRRAILNAYLNAQRRGQRWGTLVHLVAEPESGGGFDTVAADRADVHAALARLSPRQRACVILRHFDDLSISEIARRLDLSDGAVKRYLSDARHRLAPMLSPGDEGDVEIIMEGAGR